MSSSEEYKSHETERTKTLSTKLEPLCSDITKKYKDINRVHVTGEHVTGILWSTFLVFNELKRIGFIKSRHFDSFVATQCIQNNITPAKVETFLNEKMKSGFSRPTIKKHLKIFEQLGYLKLDQYGFQTTNQTETTKNHLEFRNIKPGFQTIDHFHDSALIIYSEHTFDRYRHSKFKNFFHFYASELIVRLYYNSPVTKSLISQHLNLSSEDVRAINDAFTSRHKFEHCVEQDTTHELRKLKAVEEHDYRSIPKRHFTRQTTQYEDTTGFTFHKSGICDIKEKHTYRTIDPQTHYSNRARTIITDGCIYTKSIFGTSSRVSPKLWGLVDDEGNPITELKLENERYYTYEMVLHLQSNEDVICDPYQIFITEQGKQKALDLKENTVITLKDGRLCKIVSIRHNKKKQATPNRRHKIRYWDDSIAYVCSQEIKNNSSELVLLTQFDRAQDFIPNARKVRDANLQKDLGTKYSPWIKDNKVKQEHAEKLSQVSMLDHTRSYVEALRTNGWLPDYYEKDLCGRNHTPLNSRRLYRYTFGIPTPNMFSWFRVPDGKVWEAAEGLINEEEKDDTPFWLSNSDEDDDSKNNLKYRLKKIISLSFGD